MTNPDKPIFMTSVVGSVTTYDFQNPSFMVIDLDAKTLVPTNMHTYYIDVDEANEAGKPDWRELHDYKETYAMADLRPSNFRDLALRMFTDKALATEFRLNMHRQNKNANNTVNQLSLYCGMATSEMHEKNECMLTGGMSAYGMDFKIFSKKIGTAFTDWVIQEWIDISM